LPPDPPTASTEDLLRQAGIDLASLDPEEREFLLSLTADQATLLIAIIAERRPPGPISG
jgi:hypothetical protein